MLFSLRPSALSPVSAVNLSSLLIHLQTDPLPKDFSRMIKAVEP